MTQQNTRAKTLQKQVGDFIQREVLPAESIFHQQIIDSGNPHHHPPVMEDLKSRARGQGLWNLFMPDADWGPALTNEEYAPLAELMGQSLIGSEPFNCNAPDTGNMEILARYGTPEQQDRWLRPLLDGEIRSGFAMTEPDVASSDATNIRGSISREGGEYVLNGRKWWTTGALRRRTSLVVFMGKSSPDAPTHRQQSMVLVPMEADGIRLVRNLSVFGYDDFEGHGELVFDDVRVPANYLLGEEGQGFEIAQSRLGPGRIHHCMRALGMAERALTLLCQRADARRTFGSRLADHGVIQEWIARSRCEIDQARLLVLEAARLMDTVGIKEARHEIGMIKAIAPQVAVNVVDRAIQTHGGAGVSADTPLARFFAHARTLRILDGPDEVHLRTIARRELKRQLAY